MLKRMMKRWTSLLLAVLMIVSLLPTMETHAHAAAEEIAAGLTADGTFTPIPDGIKVEATSTAYSKSTCSTTDAAGNAVEVTLKNTLGVEAELSFDYEVTPSKLSDSSFKVGEVAYTGTGTFKEKIAANGTVVLTVFSGTPASTTTTTTYTSSVAITRIALSEDKEVTTIFLPAEEGGSYTVDGNAVVAETQHTKNATLDTVMVATPDTGYQFFGWYSVEDGIYISSEANYTQKLTEPQTVTAVFIPQEKGAVRFEVGKGHEFWDLNDAVAYAESSSQSTIVLIGSGTLPAGEYTIPKGKTLLIPFDDAHTVNRSSPTCLYNGMNNYGVPSVYRMLTLAGGAILTVNGELCVNSRIAVQGQAGGWNGAPCGPGGRIEMEAGSKIQVQNGATLYAWGYIHGKDGEVTVDGSSTVWECFQTTTWRGGSHTSTTLNTYKKNKVFPMNQYYIQNIETPLTLSAGATERMFAAVNMSNTPYSGNGVLIGSSANSGLFRINTGSITKAYDAEKDRLLLKINGAAEIDSMSIEIYKTINSSDYVLPINNMAIEVGDGASLDINNDVALLPDSSLTIDKDGQVNVAADKNVYVYGKEDWNAGNYAVSAKLYPVRYAVDKGTKVQSFRTAAAMQDARIDVNGVLNVSGSLYTTESGANITSAGNSDGTNGTVVFDRNVTNTAITYQNNGANSNFVEIPVTFAQLKNADNTGANAYSVTSGAVAGDTFYYHDGMWDKQNAPAAPDNEHYPHIAGEADEAGTVICIVCGKRLSHNFADEWTADETGHWHICQDEDCMATSEKLRHDKDAGEVTIAATCTTDGVMTYICTTCGETWTEVIPAAHTLNKVDAEAATCTEDGHEAYWACSVCGKLFANVPGENGVEDTVGDEIGAIPATPASHSWDEGEVTTAPSCTETGVKTYICGTCGETKTEEVPAKGHSYVDHEAQAPSCTEKGWNAYQTCENCDYTTYEELSAKGHSAETIPAVPATCEEAGATAGEKCSVCGEVLTAPETLDALGHSWDEGEVTTAPSCTETGVKTYTCGTCGETKTEEVAAKGHSYVDHEAQAPSCTEKGWNAYQTCENCDYTTYEELSAKGHSVETIPAVPATCEEAGATAGEKCSVCGEVLTAPETLDALGHSWDEGEVPTAPSCTETGVKTYTCGTCGETKTEELPAKGHSYVDHEAQAPSCTEKGWNAYQTCENCDYTNYMEIQELGHKTVEVREKAPTCIEVGHNAYWTCATCGKVFKDEAGTTETTVEAEIIGVIPHDLVIISEATEPSCTRPAYEATTQCTRCKTTFIGKKISTALGHNHDGHVEHVDATCQSAGVVGGDYCTRCNDGREAAEKAIPATGHTYDQRPVWNWDGTESATVTFTCITDETHSVTLDATIIREVTQQATCELDEMSAWTATVIFEGATYTDFTGEIKSGDALGHDMRQTAAEVPATCERAGTTAVMTCVNGCGATTGGEPIPSKGHSAGEAVREKEIPATETETGSYDEVIYCSVCGKELSRETKIIPTIVRIYGEPEWDWDGHEAATATFPCVNDETYSVTLDATIIREVTQQATCVDDELSMFIAVVSFNGETYTDATGEITTGNATGVHTPGEPVIENEIPATDTRNGSYDEVVYCTQCDRELSRRHRTIPATTRVYGEPEWDWDGIGAATVTFPCVSDDTYTVTMDATVITVVTQQATCEQEEMSVYTAAVIFNGETYTDATDEIKTGDALGHSFGQPEWDWNGTERATASFTCVRDNTYTVRADATITSVITSQPQPGVSGSRTYTATVDFGGETYTSIIIDAIAPLPITSGGGSGGGGIGGGAGGNAGNIGNTEDLGDPDVPLAQMPTSSFPFVDVTADDWSYEAVKFVYEQGMMEGINTERTLFAPNWNSTRASIVTILYRLEGKAVTDITAGFDDVTAGAWYTDAVNWGAANDIVLGFDDGTFRPDVYVDRQQLVAILFRYAKSKGMDTGARGDLTDFADGADVSDWAQEAMQWAVGIGLIKGRGGNDLAPQGVTTRAELATIFQRFMAMKS